MSADPTCAPRTDTQPDPPTITSATHDQQAIKLHQGRPVETVAMDSIREDPQTQGRLRTDEQVIAKYADMMKAGDEFPPVVVFGAESWLADGFHRLAARRKAGFDDAEVVRHEGTLRDAVLYAFGPANSRHGLPLTSYDRDSILEAMLVDEEWRGWSDRRIARHIGCSNNTVSRRRKAFEKEGKLKGERIIQVRRGNKVYELDTSKRGSAPLEEYQVKDWPDLPPYAEWESGEFEWEGRTWRAGDRPKDVPRIVTAFEVRPGPAPKGRRRPRGGYQAIYGTWWSTDFSSYAAEAVDHRGDNVCLNYGTGEFEIMLADPVYDAARKCQDCKAYVCTEVCGCGVCAKTVHICPVAIENATSAELRSKGNNGLSDYVRLLGIEVPGYFWDDSWRETALTLLHAHLGLEDVVPQSVRDLAGELGEPVEMVQAIVDAVAPKSGTGVLTSSKSVEYYTPWEYAEAAREAMGGTIHLDPASCAEANESVGALRYFTREDNGLVQDWDGPNVYLNWPGGHGQALAWTSKALHELAAGRVRQIILCIFRLETSAGWFQPLWGGHVSFPDHRIPFDRADGADSSPVHANAFVYFGDSPERFTEAFSEFGRVVAPEVNQ